MPDTLASAHVSALLPDDVAVSFSPALPAAAALRGPEADNVSGMVTKRLNEYTHGRHCAREALRALGESPQAIPTGADRSPQWPAGIVGTITHSGPLAAAAVARQNSYAGLGLDIETAEPLDTAAIGMILLPEERDNHDASEAKLLFSIKEAVFKCIYPRVRCYVDFQEMRIELDRSAGRYSAVPCCDKFEPALIAGLEGRYVLASDYLASSAWLAA